MKSPIQACFFFPSPCKSLFVHLKTYFVLFAEYLSLANDLRKLNSKREERQANFSKLLYTGQMVSKKQLSSDSTPSPA